MRPDRTTGRAAAWVAWSLAALTVLFTVVHVTLWTLAQPIPGAVDTRGEAGLPIAFAVVGALIVTRRPDNRMGWLFCAGVVFALVPALDAYALYALAANPGVGLPAVTAVAWVVSWIWLVDFLLVVLVPLLYPTGRLLSPRWRAVLWLTGLLVLVGMVANAVRPDPLEVSQVPVAPNPVGIASAAGLVAAVDVVAAVVGALLFLAAVASVLLRFRRAGGVERQQLKWFAYASLGMVLSFVLSGVLSSLLTTSGELLVDLISGIPMLGWPVALGIAILRYRLYDIDRLINRTLVYGLLTAMLGLVYAGAVLVLGQVFGGVGSDPPSWAVAGATLAVAALFQPGRRRIQAAVDRRFNRRKYNATKTVEAFSTRLRDELDLDTLLIELLSVVDQTVQPTAASLWLRPSVSSSLGRDREARPPDTA
jgi:hypothetical protein